MKTRLFDIREMTKFHNWLRLSGYRADAISEFSSVKHIEKVIERTKQIDERDTFCYKRKLGVLSHERFHTAYKLLTYIKKRNERKKHGHK